MYGKIFDSLYSGSMVGAGSPTFAVWGYVIANMEPERVSEGRAMGAQVDLNPKLLGFILGEKEEVVRKVVDNLCGPDGKSRTKDEGGRRLVRLGEFTYRVVNGAYYRGLRTAEERREYQRQKQAEYRAAKRKSKEQVAGEGRERRFVAAVEAGDEVQADRIAAEGLPE